MSDWNPALYTRFEEERTRPAAELLARVPLASAGSVVDLGCGPGNSTELLVQRFAGAKVIGMDSSPAMLASARERLPGAQFEQGDIASWSPAAPVDLLYANASLQWLPGHEQLVPRLLSLLAPGGVLAIQMPDNLDQPSHVSMRETAAEPRFAAHIGDAGQVRARILPAEQYHDLLSRRAEVDVWRTTYYHPMADAAAIVQWLRATGLKPFLEPLSPALQLEFLAAYQARIEAAYPQRADGQRLLAFPRLFIVARRK
ncbi:MAG TPA: trans-aconitate 2-methyltransferase [Ideonella sp.]|uniref:trans-aconitate 2-methyltransferase n=1 Tax=Ideonella sp. TaxID=1929293 RepID=UPI002C1A2A40|nr:trans-aconitate 2-methyltransferase [Ideonella sp.]HSI50654.1 trans-aconitate 2-methyltransferase [Ideonella sp.]